MTGRKYWLSEKKGSCPVREMTAPGDGFQRYELYPVQDVIQPGDIPLSECDLLSAHDYESQALGNEITERTKVV